MTRIAVIAVGGNALTAEGQAGTWQELTDNATTMARAISGVLDAGWRVIVVHGNGPQVGALAIQQEEGAALVPPQPLHLLTAMTQGQLGSILVLAIERLRGSGTATAVITHVEVDAGDPAFAAPTKPIGPFVAADAAPQLAETRGWVMAEDAGRGYRRVVPSPIPSAVLEVAGVRALLAAGQVVVAGGGGGVPVAPAEPGGDLTGVEAVIDKDAVAAVLAEALGADALLLLTAVDAVRLDFGLPTEHAVHEMGVLDAEKHLADGQFPAGSMGPKVAAGVRFVRAGGELAAITSARLLAATLAGQPSTGTRIVPQGERGSRPAMTVTRVLAHRDRYRDSLVLLSATAAMSTVPGVEWAAAVMAAAPATDDLVGAGVPAVELSGLSANDLVLAVRADDDAAAAAALQAGSEVAFAAGIPGAGDAAAGTAGQAGPAPPRTLREAVQQNPAATIAIVSVPGPYAALETHHALDAGLHVLLFSDNVPVEEEVELKRRGADLGLLVMGPGAGTAILSGTGLGFANAVRRGPVGVVAAAGTGAQEVSTLLDRWGVGVSHVIGVGGRDLSAQVGGAMARLATRYLAADPGTRVLLLVSKPPSPQVAQAVIAEAASRPSAAALIGLRGGAGGGADGEDGTGDGTTLATTLEQGAVAAARLAGVEPPPLAEGLAARVEQACTVLPASRRLIRGYFCGGTLCYEAQVILTGLVGPVHSNEPVDPAYGLPAPPGAHVCLDLGAEEYTKGRPHPMIDPTARRDLLLDLAADPGADDVAVVLLDVVLGYGSHPDPAGVLAGACRRLTAGDGPRVVAYVLGATADPQGYPEQCRTLEEAGCLVPPTAARAAHAAAAIALRRPELAEVGLGAPPALQARTGT